MIDSKKLEAHGFVGAHIKGPFSFESGARANKGVMIYPHVTMGRGSYMNGGTIREHTTIGRYCSIGRDVMIAPRDHPTHTLTTSPLVYRSAWRRSTDPTRSARSGKTEIGHDVWIGDGATILRGVKVGTGAVIGARAVVTKDVEPYTVVAGVPARSIRQRFTDDISQRLLASAWWMLPEPALLSLDMGDIESCLARMETLAQTHGVEAPELITLS